MIKISKPVLFLGCVSFFTDAASEMIYPLLPLFLTEHLRASALFVGLIEGVAESTAAVTKFLFGWLSDRLRKRTRFVVAGYTLANTIRPLIGLATSPWHVLLLRFTDRIGKGMRTAPRDAWLAELADHNTRGKTFGFHRAMDHAGAVVGPLLATAFLVFYPGELRPLFLVSLIPGLIAVGFIIAAKKTSLGPIKPVAAVSTISLSASIPSSFKKFLAVLLLFTLGNSSDVFLLLKLKLSGVDIKWIPLLWSALHVVKSLFSFPGGHLADLIGRRHAIALGWALYAAVYFILGSTNHTWIVISAFLLYGLYPALTESAEKALAAEMVSPSIRGTAFGLYNLVIGLAALPASLLFGFLWTQGGPRLAFYTGATLALLASLALYLAVRERTTSTEQ